MLDAGHYRLPQLEHHPEAALAPLQFWVAEVPFNPGAPAAGDPIDVYVNEGRWVAQCPDCAGAQLASRVDPRFMCVECANALNDGAWRPLYWPRNAAAIEKVLVERPIKANRNWLPGESLKQLRAENVVFLGKRSNR